MNARQSFAGLSTLAYRNAQPAPGRAATELGTVVDLDDRKFSAAWGKKGLWEPLTFVKEVRGGIFFLEPSTRPSADRTTSKLFVSISTPWSGVRAAQWGLDFAPAVVPSWSDLAPGSEFLARMHAAPLASGLDYFLLYSCRCRAPNETGFDGAVSVESQLDAWARSQADGVFGFEAGHLAVLRSPRVLSKYFEIVDDWSQRRNPGLATAR